MAYNTYYVNQTWVWSISLSKLGPQNLYQTTSINRESISEILLSQAAAKFHKFLKHFFTILQALSVEFHVIFKLKLNLLMPASVQPVQI